ncbi:hypothetical protein CRE_15648 [Caenorhabditis remanei]|uniref:Uncharacterized protein n=1 Tax=Caenorhabditis remanei TaxID=31234 RepID=E3N847_CAERE|nr:hypothetical protein CRE_15648 [Caenorhabditis remanei]
MSSNSTGSQHEHFLHRLYGFIEYYRKQIASVITHIPAGSILTDFFDRLCSLFLRLIGRKEDPRAKYVEAEKQNALKLGPREVQEKVEALKKQMQDIVVGYEELGALMQKNKMESDKRNEEFKEQCRLEQLEKDKAADMANENLRKRSKEIYSDIMKRGTETDNLNTAKLNKDLISKLDDLEVGNKEENENDALIPRVDSGNKITAGLK